MNVTVLLVILLVILQRTKPPGILVICSFGVLVFTHWQCIIFSVFDVKRVIGRKFNDPMVQSDLKYFPFKVFDKGDKPYIRENKLEFFFSILGSGKNHFYDSPPDGKYQC
jgi:Hsp70 protein